MFATHNGLSWDSPGRPDSARVLTGCKMWAKLSTEHGSHLLCAETCPFMKHSSDALRHWFLQLLLGQVVATTLIPGKALCKAALP